MRKFIEEFKTFAVKGNVIDLAVAVVVGGAFGKIVSSFVSDLITPILGVLVSGIDFSELKLTLKEAGDGTAAITLNYGSFIDAVLQFTIIAFVIFIVVKQINFLQSKKATEEKPQPTPPRDIVLLTEIRDLLKQTK